MTFSFVNIRNTPFYMATLCVALIGALLTFIGTAIIGASGVAWFTSLYTFFVIGSVTWVIGNGTLFQYRLGLLSLITVNVVLAINSINAFIYGAGASNALVGAGFIFVALTEFLWIIAIGSDDGSAIFVALNSRLVLPSTAYPPQTNGFNGQPNTAMAHTTIQMPTPTVPSSIIASRPISPSGNTNTNTVYFYRARAKYAYTANPEDSTELSFAKDEILEIVDNKGKWWHARKADGSTGVVPSNYVEIIGTNNV
jgi:SHO1 osmosensor